MRHSYTCDGHAFRLRPIQDEDALFVVELRTDPVLNQFLHETSDSVDDQVAWLNEYYQREGDYYFVLERLTDGKREGVIALYDHRVGHRRAECGRWVLRRGSLAAAECMLLAYRMAFDVIGLEHVVCRTVTENDKVVSFHDSCGVEERAVVPDYYRMRGKTFDAVVHRVHRDSWGPVERKLDLIARKVAKKIKG